MIRRVALSVVIGFAAVAALPAAAAAASYVADPAASHLDFTGVQAEMLVILRVPSARRAPNSRGLSANSPPPSISRRTRWRARISTCRSI